MPKVGDSQVTVSGSRDADITGQLSYFYTHSKSAKLLMKECGRNGLTVTVHADGGSCECKSKTAVSMYWADCHNNLKEISESTLFEMNNSVNSEEKIALNKKLARNSISLLEYGYDFAVHEVPSTILVHDVLTELGSPYRPSVWGLKHKMSRAAATNMSIPIERVFSNAKHEADATVGWQSLKSKHLYAYEKFGEGKVGGNLRSARAKLTKIATRIVTSGTPARTVVTHDSKYTDLVSTWNTRHSCADKNNLRAFFVAYIVALKALDDSGWNIIWNQGQKGTWLDLAKEIARVDQRNPAAWAGTIAQDFRTAYP